jgi:hypothetical protein
MGPKRMSVHLDHVMVPARDKLASARLLAELLDVPWAPAGVGPFVPVYVDEGLTLDFDQWTEPIPQLHYCFRVDDARFGAILERLRVRSIAFRSNVHGPVDHRVETRHGGRIAYWNEPDGHQWEMLTSSYARRPGAAAK